MPPARVMAIWISRLSLASAAIAAAACTWHWALTPLRRERSGGMPPPVDTAAWALAEPSARAARAWAAAVWALPLARCAISTGTASAASTAAWASPPPRSQRCASVSAAEIRDSVSPTLSWRTSCGRAPDLSMAKAVLCDTSERLASTAVAAAAACWLDCRITVTRGAIELAAAMALALRGLAEASVASAEAA